MIRTRFYLLIAVLIGGIINTGCTSKNKQKMADSDTCMMPEPIAAVDTVMEEYPMLSAEGISFRNDRILIGQSLDSLPAAIPGLYDRLRRDATPEAEEVLASLGSESMFTIYSLDSGLVDVIMLISPDIKAQGGFYIGMPFRDFIKTKGITTEWASLEDEGQWYWRADGLWILPRIEAEDTKLSSMLMDHRMPPQGAEIPADAVIEFISTGLPF